MMLMNLLLAAAVVAAEEPPVVVEEPRQTDYEIIRDDLASMETHLAQTARYVSFEDVAPEDVLEARRITSYLLNSVAALRTGALTHPHFLAGGRIARFQAEWFAPEPSDLESFLQTWEQFAETNPYTCFQTEVLVGDETQVVPVVGGWIPVADAAFISERSGSIHPVVHFSHLLKSLDGDGYYKLAGIGNQDEVFAKLGIDIKLVTKLHADRAATVKRSLVANAKPRRIRVFQGVFGSAWVTYDTNKISPEKDAIRQPLSNINVDGDAAAAVTYDANEYVITGRNGLPVWLITSAEGIRQAVVSPEVARDYSETHDRYDGQIRAPFSCIRCHASSGYNNFDDYQQTLMSRGQFAYEAEDAARIKETYRDDLVQGRLEFDKGVVEVSVRGAAGTEWADLSVDLSEAYRSSVLDDVTPKEASRILHADIATAVGEITTDPYLLALAAGESITRDAWHQSVYLALLNTRGENNAEFHHLGSRHHRDGSASGRGNVSDASGPDQPGPEPDRGEDADSGASGDSGGSVRLSGIPDESGAE